MQLLPNPCLLPVRQTTPAGWAIATTKFLRQQPPSAARPQDANDALEDGAVRDTRRSLRLRQLLRQQRFDAFPEVVRDGWTARLSVRYRPYPRQDSVVPRQCDSSAALSPLLSLASSCLGEMRVNYVENLGILRHVELAGKERRRREESFEILDAEDFGMAPSPINIVHSPARSASTYTPESRVRRCHSVPKRRVANDGVK